MKATAPRADLATLLRRAHLRVALLAVLLAGLSILLVGFASLRNYIDDNLRLSAHTIAHAVEAALVFGDPDAAAEPLALIGSSEPIARLEVRHGDGSPFAAWTAPAGRLGAVEDRLAALALPQPMLAEVVFEGRRIGSVRVYGSGRDLLMFIGISVVCALLCLALTALVALRLSQRASTEIVDPLRRLAAAISATRQERAFHRRVEAAEIAEVQQLGSDFNALLEELARWQAQLDSENASLAHQARHDPLTGLANRKCFEDTLDEALHRPLPLGACLAVLFIDGDGFKAINDQLGHEAGDEVLCVIARRLRGQVRSSDLVARLGGDEFAVLMTPLDDPEQASRAAAAMVAAMERPIALPNGHRIRCSLSIGIAFAPQHASDTGALLRAADMAMYGAKRRGRNTFCCAPDPLPVPLPSPAGAHAP